jgi:hypothetical protein
MENLGIPRYPERPSVGISEKIAGIKKLVSGETAPWKITEAERAELLALESELGIILEGLVAITPRSVGFDLGYLLSTQGRKDFFDTVGIDITESITNPRDLRIFLYQHTADLVKTKQKGLTELGGRSMEYQEAEIVAKVAQTMNDRGAVDVEVMPQNEVISIRLNPDLDLKKTKELRAFKADLKVRRAETTLAGASPDFDRVIDGMYGLYQRKVNELIAGRADVFIRIQQKADLLGEESLTADEQEALSQNMSATTVPETLAIYDKFIYGSSNESDTNGWRKQISTELVAFADGQEEKFITEGLEKSESIAELGLDEAKIREKTISPEEVEKYCEETLKHYDLLSNEAPGDYVPNRPGPAPDNKWQVIVSDSYRTMSVVGKQKVIKVPNKPQSVNELISVSIAHEIEGHVIQHANQSKIPLKLFENIGSDRSTIFAEAGAMRNQDYVTEEAFGYASINHPHYVRAMLKKLAGGTYSQCVQAFYESAIKVFQVQLEQGDIDDEEFKGLCQSELAKAVNRTKRLFRGGASTTDSYPHLPESKALVYLEQVKLAHELKAEGFDDILNLTGINFEALEFLLKAQLIDLTKIQPPDFYSLEIWKKLKPEYAKQP